ncbi:MAG TPA: 50S ribosomal protein L25 [Planctomycetota bacterium]|nr:50S ribosomal protein L25 [Planctomycetota bacterium]
MLKARPRSELGSRAVGRLRREGYLPGNLYGHGQENVTLALPLKDFLRFFDAGHRVAKIELDGREEHGVIKEVQYDSLGSQVVHVDFARVDPHETIEMSVPVELVGTPKGVSGGGVLEFRLHELRLRGPADRIPEAFPLVVESLQLGQSIRLRDIKAPEGCEVVGEPDNVIVAIESATPEEAPAPAPGPSEPEVIARKRAEEGEG